MRNILFLSTFLAASIVSAIHAGTGTARDICGLKILFALDVSASLSDHEYRMQRRGLAEAFRTRAVQDAIRGTPGGLVAAVTQWASPDEQELSVDWRPVRDAADALAFAAEVAALHNPYARGGTAIGSALEHAAMVLANSGPACRRTVIDVSGDGESNMGADTAASADQLAARGVTINGLVVTADQFYDQDFVGFYLMNVVRGGDGFVEVARTFNQFPETMLRKLLREIAPRFAQAPADPAQVP